MPDATLRTLRRAKRCRIPLDLGRVLSFTSAGGAKPIVGGVGWRGLPLRTINGADSGFRRTLCIHPRLRVSAGLRFAVILLAKAIDRGNSKVRRLC